MLKVFFYSRKSHRKRQRETIEFCPPNIEPILPEHLTYVNDMELSNKKFKGKWAKFVPLNTHKLPKDKVECADVVYVWGCIPRGINRAYVLEMDNPYCICYYNQAWFRLLRPILKYILLRKNLLKIVCISEACKESIRTEFGDLVADKVSVVYPYIECHFAKDYVKEDDEYINYLFVSTSFYLKGGRETVEAFIDAHKKNDSLRLTVITRLNEVPEKYRNLDFCNFIEADMDKTLLFEKYYSKADVFILPSYQDSFGLVYLEALSFGLPIIATNMYAIPEMVVNNRNGYLVELPVHFFLDNYKMNPLYKKKSILNDIISVQLFEETMQSILQQIEKLADVNTRIQMSNESKKIFLEKFSHEIRNKKFMDLFQGI